MKVLKLFFILLLSCVLLACGKPVPQDKAAYVGEWRGKAMYLLITPDGSVDYKRLKGGVSSSISAPIKNFDGNNLEVGVGPISTVFVVNKPPFQEGDKWKMVVDGVELVKDAE